MCQKEYKNVIELCTYCKKKLKAANDPNTTGIERGLLSAFLEQRARERQSAVDRLATETKPASDKLRAQIDYVMLRVLYCDDILIHTCTRFL